MKKDRTCGNNPQHRWNREQRTKADREFRQQWQKANPGVTVSPHRDSVGDLCPVCGGPAREQN